MDVSLFDYNLPRELIARHPSPERSASRLFVVNRQDGAFRHLHFYDLPDLLNPSDLLVLNDSRVIPARLMGKRLPGGGKAEILLLREKEPLLWEAMVRPGKKIKPGDRIVFEPKKLEADIVGYIGPGERLLKFSCRGDWWEILRETGLPPLPPYILKARRDDLHTDMAHTPLAEPEDRERYQTVYARANGSVAAPTAGLHFTPGLLDTIRKRGIKIAFATLHVGAGTFKPVETERVEDHKMHSEYYEISQETADNINSARETGGRVITVGTTAVRILESVADEKGHVTASSDETDIMIYPGYEFKCSDALITNFHLPKSTLLMLVSAFAGRELILKAYREAIEKRYRFYSYGDAMIIL